VETSLSAAALGFLIGSMAPNAIAASSMATPFMILSILFGGFYINSASIPVWLGWLKNLSTIHWSFVAFCVNEFEGQTFTCEASSEKACIQYGYEELQFLSFKKFTTWEAILYLAILLVGFHIIAYLILRFNRTKYQKLKNRASIVDDKNTIPQVNAITSINIAPIENKKCK